MTTAKLVALGALVGAVMSILLKLVL